MTDTVNLGLPYIEAAQAQKHVTHNEALRILDTLVQLAVLDRDLAAPPSFPNEGQRWLIATNPTGAWLGHANHVAAWQDGAWQISVPRIGWLTYVVDEGRLLAWNGTAWTDAMSMLTTLQNITLLGVGTTADTTNPFSAKLNNALWIAKTAAEGGDGTLRYKLSKESADKTLSFLFQDNFSGRTEFGLTGDDNFHIKVSPDGSSWKEAFNIDAASGKIGFGIAVPTQTIDAVGPAAALAVWDNRSYSAGCGGAVILQASNASSARFTGASIAASVTAGTYGAEIADLVLSTRNAGILTEALRLLGAGTAVFAAGATFAGALALTTASATALAIGRLGITTPAFLVDTSTSTSITGLKIKSAASGGGVTLSAIGETNVNVAIDAAGSGSLTLNGTATGSVTTPRPFSVTSTSATAFTVAGGGYVTGNFGVGTTTPNILGWSKAVTIDTTGVSGVGYEMAVSGVIKSFFGFNGTNLVMAAAASGSGFEIRVNGNGSPSVFISAAGNVGLGTTSFGTAAVGVIAISNGTAPTSSPAGMGQLYVESGALKYRGSSGTITTIGAA